jgi:prolyl oligopeptidase
MSTDAIAQPQADRARDGAVPRTTGLLGYWLLLRTSRLIRQGQFRSALQLVEKTPCRTPTRVLDPETVSAVLDAAILFSPRRPTCLHRSVVLVLLLRRYGIAARLVIGARRAPFYAHAWVEVDGRPIGERKPVDEYSVLSSC